MKENKELRFVKLRASIHDRDNTNFNTFLYLHAYSPISKHPRGSRFGHWAKSESESETLGKHQFWLMILTNTFIPQARENQDVNDQSQQVWWSMHTRGKTLLRSGTLEMSAIHHSRSLARVKTGLDSSPGMTGATTLHPTHMHK